MTASHRDEIEENLRILKRRLAQGELDEPTYRRLKDELLADVRMGPSPLVTTVPSLAELDLTPGTVLFDQWRIVRELGRGGFGVVYEAAELHLRARQAIKVLDPAMVSDGELLARFRREVALMRELVSRHVVRVFDYREDSDRRLALISMEYVSGGTLWGLRDLARRKQVRVPVTTVA